MVIDQGTILDDIGLNFENAFAVGKIEIIICHGHPKNALPMRCIIALVALIAIMLIVLIVKNTPKN